MLYVKIIYISMLVNRFFHFLPAKFKLISLLRLIFTIMAHQRERMLTGSKNCGFKTSFL